MDLMWCLILGKKLILLKTHKVVKYSDQLVSLHGIYVYVDVCILKLVKILLHGLTSQRALVLS